MSTQMAGSKGRTAVLRAVLLGCLVATGLTATATAGAAPKIAFGSGSDGAIWTVAADGGGLKRLTSGPVDVGGPAWSHSRGTLAFQRGRGSVYYREVWLMRADGSNKRRLAYTGPSLSSGGKALAYSANGRMLAGGCKLPGQSNWAVTVLDLKTRTSRIVCRFGCENGVQSLTWSPDGRRIAATIEYGGGYGMLMIDVANARLVKELGGYASASWRADGKYVLCSFVRVGTPSVTYRLKPDGSRAGKLGKDQGFPVYSPDGSRYAFVSESGALMRANGDGAHVRTVYAGHYAGAPAWK